MFLESLKLISTQVFVLYSIAAVGFIADKVGIYTQETAKKTTDLLFNIVLPTAIIRTFIAMERTQSRVNGLIIAFICAIATHLLGIIISTFVYKKRNKMEQGIYHYGIVFSNAAFLALPLAQSVIGDEGVFFCSVYVGVFNAFAFTYGIYEISGKQAKMNFKKIILNPGTISILIGIPLFLLQPKIPYFIEKPMELVGAINSPLAMIVFGTFLANSNLKQVFAKKEIYLVSLMKLIVIPVVMMLAYKIIGISGTMLTALVISASAPTATNTAMYAGKFGNDTALASQIAAQSTVFSVITMPVIVALATVI